MAQLSAVISTLYRAAISGGSVRPLLERLVTDQIPWMFLASFLPGLGSGAGAG